ncbi:MAG TPA: ADOP family duplicated permease [Gemmatimonadaceae bacterium]
MIRPGIKKIFRLAFHRREDASRDVSDEIRLHVELRTAQLMREGLSPDAARAEAERKFGSPDDVRRTMEETATHREAVMRNREWAESFVQDLRYVLRSLRRSPTFVVSATLTLALGLGANAALFSILDRLYLEAPAGVTAPDRVVRLYVDFTNSRKQRQVLSVLSLPNWKAVQAALPAGDRMAGYRSQTTQLGADDSAPRGAVSWVIGDLFGTLGARIAAGRNFEQDEVRPETFAPVAIVASTLARERFGDERSAIGKPFDLGSHRYTIIGVADPAFRGTELDGIDAWLPMGTQGPWVNRAPGQWYEEKGTLSIHTLVRSVAASSMPTIQAAATAALKGSWANPRDTSSLNASFGSLKQMIPPGSRGGEEAIATRLAVVAFVILLIACANVANLLLARALQRRREIGVRLALGVSRTRLVAQLLTESVVLAAIGCAAAVLVAVWTASALRHALLPRVQWGVPAVGLRVIAFAATTALVAGLAAGLAPALHASRPNLTGVLRGGAREGASHRSAVRTALLMSQIALSCVLLAGAGLFVRSLQHVQAADLGVDADRLVFAGVDLSAESGRKPEEGAALLAEAVLRIERFSGVERVAFTEERPMWAISFEKTFLPGGDTLPQLNGQGPLVSFVSPGFFAAMGMRVLQGREFTREDRVGAEQVVIVNSNFARTVWPGESALGKCFTLRKPDESCRRVIAVVSNTHTLGVVEQPSMQFYVPLAQEGDEGKVGIAGTMEIRAAEGRAENVAAQVEQLLHKLARSGMQPWVQTLADQLSPEMRPWRLGAALFSAAGILALLVAAVGIYGTIAYAVGQRTQEMGVRIALGAQGSSIIALVLKSSVTIAAIGVVIGTGIAIWAGRFAKPLLYDTSPNDPYVLGGVAAVLLAVAVVASLVPAMRAKRVDPMEALRAD